MSTSSMQGWQTGISAVVSDGSDEEVIIRGHRLSDLVGSIGFAQMMYLLLAGRLPTPAQARVLDALMVASMEHGIAPPSMISRCFASYGTTIQAAMAGGILAFGDIMGGAGEQFARLLAEAVQDGGETAETSLAAKARDIVAAARQRGARIPGFGIPLHGADPRAPKMLAVARAEDIHGPHCRLAELIEAELAATGRAVPMNLDGVSAAVVLDLGFPWQATRLFLLTPRSVSMAAHFLEEQGQQSRWRHLPADEIDYTGPQPDAG